ncbi:hypothetical protein ABZP36_034330 [Zizania latifolia]
MESHGMSNDDFFHTVIPDIHDVLGLNAQSNSVDIVKSGRRLSDVPTRVADPYFICSTAQATNHCPQIFRQQVLSGSIRMKSTPRKQLHSVPFVETQNKTVANYLKAQLYNVVQGNVQILSSSKGTVKLRKEKTIWT